MANESKSSGPKHSPRKWLITVALVLAVVAVSGCKTLSFYAQAIKGEYQLLSHQQPVEKLLAGTNTPPTLKVRLQLVDGLRDFAAHDLKLPVDGHYRKYVDLNREFVVWNVEAAPEFSMEPKTWWYPIIGRQEYRGYFSSTAAQKYGDQLRRKHFDVSVGGSEAYSTLGWFKDPLLNTFIFEPEPDLAEIIFHELGHQQLFARGDTDFNEAFATTVGQEGARRWLRTKGDQAMLKDYQGELMRTAQFAHLIMQARLRLEDVYGDERTEEGKVKATKKRKDVPTEQLRAQKQQIFDELRQQYAELKKNWNGSKDYDGWFAREINNARLNSVAAYYDFVPGFERLLELNNGDLPKFYAAAEEVSKLPKKERHEKLRELAAQKATLHSLGSQSNLNAVTLVVYTVYHPPRRSRNIRLLVTAVEQSLTGGR